MSIIDEIVEEYHAKLGACRSTLQICGDSPFTRALAKRCREWGVPYAMVEDTDPGYPVVVDYEVKPGAHAGHSIDDAYTLSACAEGILRLCERIGVAGKVVTIVGRRHAVKGLAAALLAADATVCVCHSKTEPGVAEWFEEMADVIVDSSASDGINIFKTGEVFSNAGIGRLTTAILAYRASIWEG